MDTIYYPKNIEEKFVLIGITSTSVTFNPQSERWEMFVRSKKEKTTGLSKNSFRSFLLGENPKKRFNFLIPIFIGKSTWTINQDTARKFLRREFPINFF